MLEQHANNLLLAATTADLPDSQESEAATLSFSMEFDAADDMMGRAVGGGGGG